MGYPGGGVCRSDPRSWARSGACPAHAPRDRTSARPAAPSVAEFGVIVRGAHHHDSSRAEEGAEGRGQIRHSGYNGSTQRLTIGTPAPPCRMLVEPTPMSRSRAIPARVSSARVTINLLAQV